MLKHGKMRRGGFALIAITAMIVLQGLTSPIARADDAARPEVDPRAVAKKCAAEIGRTVEACTRYHDRVASEAIERIEALQAEGKRRAAAAVAREASEKIRRKSNACAKEVRNDSRACVAKLNRMDAPVVARELIEFAERKLKELRQSEVGAIRSMFAALRPNSTDPAT